MKKTACSSLSLCLLVLCGCGPQQVTSHPSPEARLASPAAFEPQEVGRATITLLAISDRFTETSWSPSGEPMEERVTMESLHGSEYKPGPRSTSKDDRRAVSLFFAIEAPATLENPSFKAVAHQGELIGSIVSPDRYREKPGPDTKWFVQQWLVLEPEQQHLDLEIMVAAGEWKTLGEYRRQNQGFARVSGFDFAPVLFDNERIEGGEAWISISVHLPASIRERDFRVVAFNREGNPMMSSGAMTNKENRALEFSFVGSGKMVEIIRLEYRDFARTSFSGIKVQPAQDRAASAPSTASPRRTASSSGS
jgi:hypothetical protein